MKSQEVKEVSSCNVETHERREPYAYLLSLQEMSGESKGVIQLMAIRTFSLLDLQILCFNLFLSSGLSFGDHLFIP